MNVLRGVEVALVVLPAHRADPLTNLEVLEFWVLAATVVAELARREEGVYKHDLCSVTFRQTPISEKRRRLPNDSLLPFNPQQRSLAKESNSPR